jgi:hypothetical protein
MVMRVCCSNFDLNTKEDIENKVISLGGKFCENLKKSTNVLISNKAGTNKCIVII